MPVLTYLWILPLLPLLGAAANGIFGRHWKKSMVSAVALSSTTLAFIAAVRQHLAIARAIEQELGEPQRFALRVGHGVFVLVAEPHRAHRARAHAVRQFPFARHVGAEVALLWTAARRLDALNRAVALLLQKVAPRDRHAGQAAARRRVVARLQLAAGKVAHELRPGFLRVTQDQRVGDTRYFDAAGFPGRTVGLFGH